MSKSSVVSVLIQTALNGRHVDFTFPKNSFPIHPGTKRAKQIKQSRSNLADDLSAPYSYLQSDMIKAQVTEKTSD